MNPKAKVVNVAPMNPSHVFLGERAIRGVFPKSFPKIKAKTSFAMTSKAGSMNQIIPW